MNPRVKDALVLGALQFLNWGVSTISWRAVAQANILASVITDSTLATLTYFVLRRIAKSDDTACWVAWLGYTVGGVAGTIAGVYLSLWLLGR